jgi:serine/threonine protein kinase
MTGSVRTKSSRRSVQVGWMGEVYRATDTRLRRMVALKVLRSEAAGDPEMRERFQREDTPSPRFNTRTSAPFTTLARRTASTTSSDWRRRQRRPAAVRQHRHGTAILNWTTLLEK